jgi:hypothetical protein
MPKYSEYLNNIEDEFYLKPIPSMVPKGSLPNEDFEIFEHLALLRIRLEQLNRCSLMSFLFQTKNFKEKKAAYIEQKKILELKVLKDEQYKIAFRRIMNSLNDSKGAKKILNELWQKSIIK